MSPQVPDGKENHQFSSVYFKTPELSLFTGEPILLTKTEHLAFDKSNFSEANLKINKLIIKRGWILL